MERNKVYGVTATNNIEMTENRVYGVSLTGQGADAEIQMQAKCGVWSWQGGGCRDTISSR